ncbi:protocadherin beta-15-like isoform X2 [Pristis pectinata]|uniref:protocadherin beta-15-like isoform X2 n=1 Tax=Pristis pectinata TaxID=685728 RepID=UPI00223D9EE4|nr:protocadherin beta-15-like isoform X2 [Pristis pectinata]
MGYCRIYCSRKWHLLYCLFSFWGLVSGQIRYSIPEELQLGAFVGNIADDLGLDVKELSARNFRVVPGLGKKYLDVNLDNGILFVKENIDREQLCGSSLTCLLSMEAVIENPLNVYRIEVEVLDINDNAPNFPKNQFRLEISEVAAPGARFPLECAYDSDVGTNSLQNYRLVGNQYFALDIETRSGDEKLPVLTLERALDREKEATHKLQLIAEDGGVPPRSSSAEILIAVQDANDNSPVFSQSMYRVSLNENVPKGTLVIKLNATDLDDGSNGDIEYSFTSHTSATVRELFDLNSKTGEIKVKGNLDYELNSAFEINVQAMDKGSAPVPAYCRVHVDIIDVNDNAPEVTVTSLFSPVGEDSPAGTVIALVSTTDKDSGKNGEVDCQIPNNLPFKLNSPLINYYKLVTVDQLDRENIPKYDVTLLCRDSGSTPLTSKKTMQIEISDVNDNSPRFSQSSYTAYVMENNVIGASVISVTATDPDLNQNAKLSFSIPGSQVQSESVANYVYINSENGIVFSQRSFNYEELKSFQFQVQAQDSGIPPLTSNVSVDVVILDQNDNAPVILHPLPERGSTVLETMSRSAEPGYLVTKVSAMDADSGQNARLSYRIVQTTDPGLFTISPDTGEVWTIRRMVEKDAKKQKLTIVVKDNGTPPLSASMTISLSVVDGDAQLLSDVTDLDHEAAFNSALSFYLVISLGAISSIFLLILIILAVKVHKSRSGFGVYSCYGDICCCYKSRRSLNGIQKASRNIQIPPNYVEVFGGDPLSQSFRYGTNSTIGSTKRNYQFPNTCSSSAVTNKGGGGPNEKCKYLHSQAPENCRNSVNTEVKQPNTDWRLSQTHRAELNSSQYLEEEGVQREIQCEVQREVQRDVQREVPRDVQCDVPRNVQRDLQRDVHCDVQHVAENDPGGPRKPMCARPPAIPAGRDGWTLPRTAPRMQLQMTLGTHVPGTLRSQYLFPREPCTPGARISNSNVEFSAFPIGSLHCPWAANQTRDHRGLTHPGSRRPELDTEACGEIPCSPSSLRLSTQRLHSRDHHHALRQVNN